MKHYYLAFLTLAIGVFSTFASAQVDEFCAEFGAIPTLESARLSTPYVYGHITYRATDSGAKFPRITVIYIEREQAAKRITVSERGSYCFRRSGGAGGGTLLIDIDGVEVARRGVSGFGTAQVREDFDIAPHDRSTTTPPSVVSAKFPYPRTEKVKDLFIKTSEAEASKDVKQAIKYMTDAVASDPRGFIAWAKLGTLYLDQKAYSDAESAFRKSLELKPEYTPAWINAGKVRTEQKQYEAAVEVFKHAITLDPSSARTYQLLGEAYLMTKRGSLGAEALNKALEMDPIGMAECHLQLAHLYQLAKANDMAAKEYKAFLEKAPNHPDKKKFEKFIKEHSR